MNATYTLPIRRDRAEADDELVAYLHWLAGLIEIVVVDGSPPDVFALHAAQWGESVTHLPPDPDLRTPNGKVWGVLTGIRHARHERLIIADDDVRYDADGLMRMLALLDAADVVRPQNYFDPLPWHAHWDTARSLLNRVFGGDWPGTLGVRRSVLRATGGYDGGVLFENLELVRTVRAAGGVEVVPLDLFVRRLPPDTAHFWGQRVRQAYDEFARPLRMGVWLAVLPFVGACVLMRRWNVLFAAIFGSMSLAEWGRRRANGTRVFPFTATLMTPFWIAERTVCTWLAVGMRLIYGGVRYRDGVLSRAATPMNVLRERFARHNADRLKGEDSQSNGNSD